MAAPSPTRGGAPHLTGRSQPPSGLGQVRAERAGWRLVQGLRLIEALRIGRASPHRPYEGHESLRKRDRVGARPRSPSHTGMLDAHDVYAFLYTGASERRAQAG